MQLILTHENADFDAIASQLAASKLYPESVPLLPRRINRNVQQFLTLYWDVLPFTRPEDWKRRRVDEVLLVDTHSLSSVRGMIRKPRVHVIDHHKTRAKHDNWTFDLGDVGATTTLLVEKLQAAGLTLLPEEATLLLLGIYEDTGSMTYDTTTPQDIRAASWLLEQGAQLAVVRQFLNIPLTPVQWQLYDQLQTAVSWIEIGGQSLVVTAVTAPDDFDDEISSVVHRLRETLAPVALFVLVQLGQDVQLVARSTNDSVNVAVIAKAFGGGGHPRAAAAIIIGQHLADVKARLLDLLPQSVQPIATVAEIMSYGVKTLLPAATVAEAEREMQRFGYEGYPVYDEETDKLVGLLTRRGVDRATNHQMQDSPISRVMKAGSFTVRPSDSIERVQQLMLDEGWGQIPVVLDETKSTRPIGIVTRTDVLNFLFKPSPGTAVSNLRSLLTKSLPPAMWGMVLAVSEKAAELQMPLYFVGGLVRDLLLGKTAVDLDMVVEGDAIKLVRHLQKSYGGEVHTHQRFGTGKWFVTPEIWQTVKETGEQGSGDQRSLGAGGIASSPQHPSAPAPLPETIDFVTARSEFYTEPSALPEVTRGSIKLDLHRRDFTINTLAVRLDGAHLGELLDFYGGRRDLEQGLIRVLHSLSFVDDPTRMLRAVRLEQRLRFRIEARTAELMASALPMLDRVTGDRIRHEIELALRESVPAAVMARLAKTKILAQIHPALHWSEPMAGAFTQVDQELERDVWQGERPLRWRTFLYFTQLLAPLAPGEQEAVMSRLRVRKATREDVMALAHCLDAVGGLPADPRPSQIERVLRPYHPRVLLAARIVLDDTLGAAWVERYYAEWRDVKTAVSGDDLRQMGLKPGPEYSIILDQLLAARLDGQISSEVEEQALLKQILSTFQQQ
ncbi:MAG: CBS domain-containing protein [Ardenticatenaceae bacterium]|nr:CBS domain-containing protein [Ardenticatenaceae bacterium]